MLRSLLPKSLLLVVVLVAAVLAQDESVCTDIRNTITATTYDKDRDCTCTDEGDDGTRLTCSPSKDICISTSERVIGVEGTLSETLTQSNSGPSATAVTEVKTCFDYADEDVYGGSKVCLTKFQDILGTNANCEITINDEPCVVCRFCFIDQVTFDCSNLGYEFRLGCAADNSNASLLQFLYEPEVVDDCDVINDGGRDGSGNGSWTLTNFQLTGSVCAVWAAVILLLIA